MTDSDDLLIRPMVTLKIGPDYKAGYTPDHLRRDLNRLRLEVDVLNARLGAGPITIDQAETALQLHLTEAHLTALENCLPYYSRWNLRRWLYEYRIRKIRRELGDLADV